MTIENTQAVQMPSEIVVFNRDTLRQSDRVTKSALEVPKKIVIEYNQKANPFQVGTRRNF